MVSVISLDMGCTLFWERGCEVGWMKHTLYKSAEAVAKTLVELGYNVSVDDVYGVLYNIAEEHMRTCPEREIWHLYRIHIVLSRLGIIPKPRLVQRLYESYVNSIVNELVFEEKYRDVLRRLKERGYMIVLSTDTGSHDIPLRLVDKAGIGDYIDFILSSQLIGYTKASQVFFQNLINLTGVDAKEIVHVGDNVYRDYEVPRSLGIKTVLYKKNGCSDEDPEPCISDLGILLELLEKL
ncbi:HAD family hydrolase [Desulfurococcaceae archaeon MEX13E-LK6-19]|nr:HAD family hydrolase [Desulfurococcaceae archaeon MEX13E-LK6-19]